MLDIHAYRHPYNGSLELSTIVGLQLIRRVYYGYTLRQATQAFRAELRELQS